MLNNYTYVCCILTSMKQDYSSTHPPDWTHIVIINAQKKGYFFFAFFTREFVHVISTSKSHLLLRN